MRLCFEDFGPEYSFTFVTPVVMNMPFGQRVNHENDRIRLVSDSHGTVWDTVFTVKAEQRQTELTMVMDAKAYKLLPKLINPLIKGMVKKAIMQDMNAVKTYCEQA